MRLDKNSLILLRNARALAKAGEFFAPDSYKVPPGIEPKELFPLTISILGNYARYICEKNFKENHESNLINSSSIKEETDFVLRFSDAIREGKVLELSKEKYSYIQLLNSAAYYIGDKPGSSEVIAKILIKDSHFSDGSLGIDKSLLDILNNNNSYVQNNNSKISQNLHTLLELFSSYQNGKLVYDNKNAEHEIAVKIKIFRNIVYEIGSPWQLLLADLLGATIIKKVQNSIWFCLYKKYTNLPLLDIMRYHDKSTSIKELWPSQHLLGKHDILRGDSAVVQMPTSAGKTKACEIIIRNLFVGTDSKFAVIVAPYVALCNEIRNQLEVQFQGENIIIDRANDELEQDFTLSSDAAKTILVATPEKLLYMIRSDEGIATSIRLLVLDEGHQFDNDSRGTTYELLVTSLLEYITSNCQLVLISAVINNASDISKWMLGKDKVVKSQKDLSPTYRSLAFIDEEEDQNGDKKIYPLKFYSIDVFNDNREFYVPVLKEKDFENNPINKKPSKSNDIAIILAAKIAKKKESVSIFFSQKRSIYTMMDIIKKLTKKKALGSIRDLANSVEIQKLAYQAEINLGENSAYLSTINAGVLVHHGTLLPGMRVTAEHAIKSGAMSVILCTSTLSQGVNMPVKYLLITSPYQIGNTMISAREFQNLIGRVGRSGMQTEGSIIFTNPELVNTEYKRIRCLELLNLANSEPCTSILLDVTKPIINEYVEINISELLRAYFLGDDEVQQLIKSRVNDDEEQKNSLTESIKIRLKHIGEIESFLMSHWKQEQQFSVALAQKTLAYYLAQSNHKKILITIFEQIESHLREQISWQESFSSFGKSGYGFNRSKQIRDWIVAKIDDIMNVQDTYQLLDVIHPILQNNITGKKVYDKIPDKSLTKYLIIAWCKGAPYFEIVDMARKLKICIKKTKDPKPIGENEILELCDNTFPFDASHFVGIINEHIDGLVPPNIKSIAMLLQKQLKCGLPTQEQLLLYEIGFVDRELCKALAKHIELQDSWNHKKMKEALVKASQNIIPILEKYPTYFKEEIFDKRVCKQNTSA